MYKNEPFITLAIPGTQGILNKFKIMLHKDRFLATINNEPVDRPASWLGLPVPASESGLKRYFKVGSVHKLKELIDDDIYPVEVPYNYPPSNHIACAFDFAKKKYGKASAETSPTQSSIDTLGSDGQPTTCCRKTPPLTIR